MHLGHSTYCCVARGGASRPRSGMRPRHHLAINGILTSRSHILWAILQQGVRFDPDMPQTIRLEFAKSNTKVSKPKQQAANAANTHPTLMHPLTGRKYTGRPRRRGTALPDRTPFLTSLHVASPQ
jgi:hypothetical protein